MVSRSIECKYNHCGKPFTSKARMKEHVLWHLEIDPPKPIQQHARIRYRTSGSGWVVLRDLGPEDRGEGSSSGKRASQADSELERFRLADMLPLASDSQAGNVTTTTTTSGGTVSQPISFSPVLPDRPSQISLPSQITGSPFLPPHPRSLPTPARPGDHSMQSPAYPSIPRSTSRDLVTPFVHSAPKSSRPPTTDSPASPTSISRRSRTSHSPTKRPRTSASPFMSAKTKDLVFSPPGLGQQVAPSSRVAAQSVTNQYPPASATDSSSHVEPSPGASITSSTPQKGGRSRTLGFGEALGSTAKIPAEVKLGVGFSFAAPR